MNPVSKGNVATVRIVGKRHDEAVLVDAEVGQGDDVGEDQFAVVVELEEMSAEDEGIVAPPPSVETLVYGDGAGDAEMSAEIKKKEHTVKSLEKGTLTKISLNHIKVTLQVIFSFAKVAAAMCSMLKQVFMNETHLLKFAIQTKSES